MSYKRTKKLRVALTPIAIALFAAFGPLQTTPALAQAQDSYAVDLFKICASTIDQTARLACFDAAAKSLNASSSPTSTSAPAVPAVSPPSRVIEAPVVPAAPIAAPIVAAAPQAIIAAPSAPIAAPVVPAVPQAVVAAPSAPISAPVVPEPKTPSSKSFVAAEDPDKDTPIAIHRIEEFDFGKKRFYLVNGQVWQQTSSRDIRVPKQRKGKPANTVTIVGAFAGGSLLKVNDKGSAVRVKRIR